MSQGKTADKLPAAPAEPAVRSDLGGMEARAAALDASAAPDLGLQSGSMMNAPGVVVISPEQQRRIDEQKVAGELSVLLSIVSGFASTMWPKLANVWTQKTIADVAESAAVVAVKRGWSAGILSKWEAEIGLALVVLPLVGPTLDAMQEPEPEKDKGKGKQKPAVTVTEEKEPPKATEEDVLSRPVLVAVDG
jgi:hypothetical protein